MYIMKTETCFFGTCINPSYKAQNSNLISDLSWINIVIGECFIIRKPDNFSVQWDLISYDFAFLECAMQLEISKVEEVKMHHFEDERLFDNKYLEETSI